MLSFYFSMLFSPTKLIIINESKSRRVKKGRVRPKAKTFLLHKLFNGCESFRQSWDHLCGNSRRRKGPKPSSIKRFVWSIWGALNWKLNTLRLVGDFFKFLIVKFNIEVKYWPIGDTGRTNLFRDWGIEALEKRSVKGEGKTNFESACKAPKITSVIPLHKFLLVLTQFYLTIVTAEAADSHSRNLSLSYF